MENHKDGLFSKNGISYFVPFVMITTCFALWGFANDVTNPMVKSYSTIFQISNVESSLVQVAFYLGYFVMAFPAAMFIQKYSFKSGVVLGLFLYAIGALAFIPARYTGIFYPFLAAYLVMTCGLSFLETSCNPYIYCMGSEDTATRRLNLAQAFNPIGAVSGTFVAWLFVQQRLDPTPSAERFRLMSENLPVFNAMKDHDLGILIQPYIYIGIVVVVLLITILSKKMPKAGDSAVSKSLGQALRELSGEKNYCRGVIAQFFYIGAQVTCWTFIMHYGHEVFCAQGGMTESAASALSFRYYIGALILFAIGRFVCTYFLKYVSPSSCHTCLLCNGIADGCYFCRRYNRNVVSRRYKRLHVSDVSHNIWPCPSWSWRQCEIRWCRSYHVNTWRFCPSPHPGSYNGQRR